jgi:PAS domain S-box-containing protein
MEKPMLKPHILESISDGVFTVDHDWRVTSFNKAAEQITGISRDDALDRYCWDVFRSNICKGDCPLRKTIQEGKPYINIPAYIYKKDDTRIPISISTALLHDEHGEILGGVETFRNSSVVEEFRQQTNGSFKLGGMVSRSQLMKKIFTILPKIAMSDSTVLIEGDTGTGKEILAKAVHELSLRHKKPFIAINCGALPDTLLESELFGYKAGAFTDAVTDKPGYFTLADGGTIMLDELGETSPAFQAKLLRVLEEREFHPLGGISKQKVNVRILAATNSNLEKLVEEGSFRQDLFYRINVVRLCLPQLKNRMEDIPVLINTFIERLNKLQDKAVAGVDKSALKMLMSYGYPGNIRELENIIEHAFILCSQGQIGIQHLPDYLSASTAAQEEDSPSIKAIRRTSEEDAIRRALKRNQYNRLAAAKELGMHKTTLFRKLKKYQISLPETDGRSCRSIYDHEDPS